MSKIILNWARWLGPTPANANSWNWLGHWLKGERAAFFFILGSILSAVGISRLSPEIQADIKKYILLIGGFGITFMMYGAPSFRFGLGYLCLLPTFLMAAYCYKRVP